MAPKTRSKTTTYREVKPNPESKTAKGKGLDKKSVRTPKTQKKPERKPTSTKDKVVKKRPAKKPTTLHAKPTKQEAPATPEQQEITDLILRQLSFMSDFYTSSWATHIYSDRVRTSISEACMALKEMRTVKKFRIPSPTWYPSPCGRKSISSTSEFAHS
ncbi:hypothetical protein B0A50_08204 [Salinomyces thailandicus]|uniref:Uncharacterized protein n=1 Tax=Salinomyces thailandicus TaxID=706561 RepID=A0A4U0TK47_9PEZI|nr:hypothetical protein B0A50_08204 [Salinomyces thailandica]